MNSTCSQLSFEVYKVSVAQKGMVGKKSRGLSWRVFALMAPKVGPMALGTSAGLVGI